MVVVDEKTLPYAIKHDIEALKEARVKDPSNIDLYLDELYGSINGSQHSFEITKEVADYLREKYLGI